MEDRKDTPNITKVNEPAGLTQEQLFKMLIQSQKDNAEANSKLAEALLLQRVPYVDPNVLAAKQLALEERRKEVEKTIREKAAIKRACPHRRTNSDGSFHETKMNIKWMEHSNGIILGVCGTCFSQFDARKPDDYKWLQKDGAAINTMGRARDRATRVISGA